MARLARMPARKSRSTRNFYDTQKVRRIHHGRCNHRGFDNKEHRSTSGTTKCGTVGEVTEDHIDKQTRERMFLGKERDRGGSGDDEYNSQD